MVRLIVGQYYEEGRQDRCLLWVYRHKVKPVFGISERTFFRCLSKERDEKPVDGPVQLVLNFDCLQ